MPTEYAPGRPRIPYDSPLGVEFVRQSNEGGVLGDTQYRDHETGAWENEFDAAKHVRVLDRQPDSSGKAHDQSFAVPLSVTDNIEAFARIYVLGDDGAPMGLYDTIESNRLYSLTRPWSRH